MATTSMRVPRTFASSICRACRQRLLPSATTRRASTTTPSPRKDPTSLFGNTPTPSRSSNASATSFSEAFDVSQDSLIAGEPLEEYGGRDGDPHRLHIYATKHNTHITLVQPPKPAYLTASSGISRTSASAADQKKQIDVLLSLSAGNIGFRKAGRGSYDAAYQLGAFVCKQIQEKGMLREIRNLQVVLRGFGAGREAVTKVLLGSEGRFLRGKIESVVDATRLKQGGDRSKKPRRLG